MFISIVLAAHRHTSTPEEGFNKIVCGLRDVRSLTSQSRGYGCTIPLSHRFFAHRVSRFAGTVQSLAKASVPKFRPMAAKFLGARKAKRRRVDVEILHVVTAFTVFDDVPAIEEEKYRRQ